MGLEEFTQNKQLLWLLRILLIGVMNAYVLAPGFVEPPPGEVSWFLDFSGEIII